ncbi:hypothetical protein C5167_020037 [Papaver somniferum]|uniref:BHLH domain-containing protein n=1 Tax=Papaver somniferum TaxID=3469 RepID=A0A4Y7IV10_PAPSO|nr:transcription factor bHLH93-like [Papaver somniferum]RZC51620.1 hypothetical protein C5167_020037 [Papaver somniferum]
MEGGLSACSLDEELNQASMNNLESIIFDAFSSWLDLDDSSIIPQEPQQLQDLEMLDENLLQFANTTTTSANMDYEHPYSECNILPNSPELDLPFLLDIHDFDNDIISPPEGHYHHPVLPCQDEVILDQPVDNEAECEKDPNSNSIVIICPSSSVSDVPQQPRQKKQKNNNIKKRTKLSTQRHQSSATTTAATTSTVPKDDGEEEIDDERKRGPLSCKNLVSERNRRERISQQLLALRGLVPNITKIDRRSVLVDALSYLRNMQEETAKIQKELKEQQSQHQPRAMNNDIMEEDEDAEHDPDDDTRPRVNSPVNASKPKPQIIEIDIEKMDEKRFIVKVTCKGVNGGDICRVMEATGFEITYAAVEQIKPQHFLSTVFIKVKKHKKMTEEKLKNCIISSSLRCGLIVLPA